MSFFSLANKFLEQTQHNRCAETLRTYGFTIKFFLPFVAGKNIKDILTEDIQNYLNTRPKSMARKDLINIRAILNYAVKKKYIKVNVAKEIKLIKLHQQIPLYFSYNDFQNFISIVDDKDTSDIIIAAINTGMRLGELLNLTLLNIHDDTIIINSLKGYKIRSIPINQTFAEVLKGRQIKDFVFTYRGQQWKERRLQIQFKKYLRKTNLNPRLPLLAYISETKNIR